MLATLTEARPAYHPHFTEGRSSIGCVLPAGTEVIITGLNEQDRMTAKTRTGYVLNVGVDEVVEVA